MTKYLLLFLFVFSSCGKYVNFTSNEYTFFLDSGKKIDAVQFYNAKDFVIWQDNSSTLTDVSNKGVLKQKTQSFTNVTIFEKKQGVLCRDSEFGSDVLLVLPTKGSKNFLQFQKLKEMPYEIREQFTNEILQNKKVNNDLYYLFPKRIEQCTVNRDVIYGKPGFFNRIVRFFKGKKYVTIKCCVIDWEGEEWKLYMKNATYLQIKRNDSSKSKLNIKKSKGNYVN